MQKQYFCFQNSTFYPLLRLLLPDKERERSAYNLKEKKLGQLLVKVLSLSKLSNDATKLLNFRAVNNSQGGDFGHVAYYVLKNRMGTNCGTLTVGDINNILDKIAAAEAGNKARKYSVYFSFASSKVVGITVLPNNVCYVCQIFRHLRTFKQPPEHI